MEDRRDTKPRIGFVLELALGHATHAANLQTALAASSSIEPVWLTIPSDIPAWGRRIPFVTNWTVRAGWRARHAIRAAHRERPLDALFVHTQVSGVLNADWIARIPSVVSLDATPIQYDRMGAVYGHTPGSSFVERLKWRANRRVFDRARAVVCWSTWAKAGVVADYGVPAEKVTVIPPGVWFDEWARPEGVPTDESIVRILFVGGDFVRKGGPTLVAAFDRLRDHVAAGIDGVTGVELHLVTGDRVEAGPDTFVYNDLTPNSDALRGLYRRCHVFCLPTRGDMLGLVLAEAGAAGLARVSTLVGGTGDLISDGETGLLVPPDDVDALAAALLELTADAELRRRLGAQAIESVRADFDAGTNAARLVDLLARVAQGSEAVIEQ